MESILSGRDTLALMPTGGGKSLCYQVPAMSKPGLCIVISPLIALMKDQVENLKRRGITAFAIHTGMKRHEVVNVLELASNSNCKFLYVSPERLETALFLEYLPAMDVSLIAVDEAHCISQWGYDFRPPYLRIAALRDELPDTPILALTASATPEVQADICDKLGFTNHNIFKSSFSRPNLSYSVFEPDSKINKLSEVLSNVPGTGIAYCMSRRKTVEIADQLRSYGLSSDFYHAGLTGEERSKKQEAWIRNETRVIVCTNAFGMGIDKPDVRVVVHMDVPDCLENYYQEAGRGGRDEKKAYAVLLYKEHELEDLRSSVDERFPSITVVREVYQALANYYQLETGRGEGQSFDFDISDFSRKFKIPVRHLVNVLRLLQQEELLSFNEQVFLPAKVQFICNKDQLYEFENKNPMLEPLVKLLLRNYEGIFDIPVPISERQLSVWMKTDDTVIVQQLQVLVRFRIISYEPQKDKPQLYFIKPRVRIEDLEIDQVALERRKQRFIARVEAFINFIHEKEVCRGQQIAVYFGDNTTPACGVCDNCLRRKKMATAEQEFEVISNRIRTVLGDKIISPLQLVQELKEFNQENVWKVISFLQSERKILLTHEGKIRAAG